MTKVDSFRVDNRSPSAATFCYLLQPLVPYDLSPRRTISILILCLASPSLVFSQRPAKDLNEKLTAYMENLQRRGEFSGTVLLARDGKVLFARGYGMANLEHDVPNTINTKFRLGSVTKQFTAAGIMMLQERRKLSVHDSICVYVQDCPDSWKPITINHLLSHTSGIPSFTLFPDNDRYERLPMQVVDTIARFKDKPLEFPPGERFQYSDSGYLLLGYIIEQASGEKYEDFIRKNIYEPLHMQNSGYDHPWVILKHRAQGYGFQNGSLVNATCMAMDTPLGGGRNIRRWVICSSGTRLSTPRNCFHENLCRQFLRRIQVPTLRVGALVTTAAATAMDG